MEYLKKKHSFEDSSLQQNQNLDRSTLEKVCALPNLQKLGKNRKIPSSEKDSMLQRQADEHARQRSGMESNQAGELADLQNRSPALSLQA